MYEFSNINGLQWVGLFSGLLLLVMLALSVNVVIGRNKHRVLLGDGGNPEMAVASRGFGNAAEYIPAAIGMLTLLALTDAPHWLLQTVGGLMLAGRIIHPFGLKATGGMTLPRLIGMVMTWLSLAIGSVSLVWIFIFAQAAN